MNKLKCPAKLNLFLKIIGERNDGYHDLQTYFQAVDLCDYLNLYHREDDLVLYSDNYKHDLSNNNSCVKAAELVKNYTGIENGIEIQLEKNIPVGAGLGGGSSNAASTILGLNNLWDLKLSEAEMLNIGRQIGADVPFFVKQASCFAEGIGDELIDVDQPQRYFVIIDTEEIVQTKEIYQLISSTDSFDSKINDTKNIDCIGYNFFEKIVCKKYPKIQEILEILRKYQNGVLTGTGGSVYSYFESIDDAKLIFQKLPDTLKKFLAKGLKSYTIYD